MTLTLVTIPCRADNYAFLVHDEDTGETALFDAPEAAPILAGLDARGWRLTDIFLTHHHGDHIEGVPELLAVHDARVIGAGHDKHRLPDLDLAVAPDEIVNFSNHDVQVLAADGHTIGHVAYYMPDAGAAFTGDSLMALGCGRLFEGTPEQMWETLTTLAALPDETLICSGHEYTASNARFALSVEPQNPDLIARAEATTAMRERGEFTVPSTLSLEKATNPFLRAYLPQMKEAIGQENDSDAEVFAAIRRAKDNF
ncbi:hydroxyacylglutathione hydrolase [Maritimibacter sp. DP1N21-5]|uniref:hydroxyacylglutathione hydrolase n=1 Tax=Maritimibacter sp. DP1N21-5 TaxID=2836867 RepID=UPI001C4770C3|nr:hydroxyacylglutathione hydrolase [Maritimibacter sp. DP1N21-5]MBV7410415.1 hydroxyacylglutathione hydrolase [Maritimibacter sp. DP1N21-5]